MTKKEMRKQYLQARKDICDCSRKNADSAICQSLSDFSDLQQAKNVAAYISDGTEVDLNDLIEYCLKVGKKVFLPRYSASSETGYEMVEINDLSLDLVPGKYGLMEPLQKLPAAAAGQINDILWLVPGVAFDHKGARLGRGKGIYDRLLSKSDGLSIGIFYECQKADEVPAGEHDQKMDIIVTEKMIYKINHK